MCYGVGDMQRGNRPGRRSHGRSDRSSELGSAELTSYRLIAEQYQASLLRLAISLAPPLHWICIPHTSGI
jgi:hypothetical protein